MTDRLQMNGGPAAIPLARLGMGTVAIACAVALIAGALALGGFRAAWAQGESPCVVNDFGVLGAEPDSELQTQGRWTTEGCDSHFRIDSDSHTYRFEVVEGGRIRIDLMSAEGDSYLYLLAEDGSRITDNDDGGAGLDARVERDLEPGIYLVEATTVGGRGRGPADFTISISRVTGCEPVPIGALGPGVDLTAIGSWTSTPAVTLCRGTPRPQLHLQPAGGRSRADRSEINAVLSLVSLSRRLDLRPYGGEGLNSRMPRYLTRVIPDRGDDLRRDLQPLRSDFTLVIQLVDEEAEQRLQLKLMPPTR